LKNRIWVFASNSNFWMPISLQPVIYWCEGTTIPDHIFEIPRLSNINSFKWITNNWIDNLKVVHKVSCLLEPQDGIWWCMQFHYRLIQSGFSHVFVFYSEPIEIACRDVNVFIFQINDSFVMKTTTKNRKRNDRF